MARFTGKNVMFLHATEVRPHDIIIAYLNYHHVLKPTPEEFEKHADSCDRRVVTKIANEKVYTVYECDDSLNGARAYLECHERSPTWAVVVRTGFKFIPRWPHKCPRCDRKAYVGLNEVTHRDPNVICPAPAG